MKKVIISVVAILVLAGAGVAIWAYQQSNSVANDPARVEPSAQPAPRADITPEKAPVESKNKVKVQKATLKPRNNETISGTVTLIGDTIRLERDFRTENGPDLFLYIGDANDRDTKIARLKAANGAQNYRLPDDITASSITHIWIYCRAFNVNFGVAAL